MSDAALVDAGGARKKSLLKRAVHRSPALSADGVMERLFTFAFRGLVYPQIWEDPAVDLAAMDVKPHHHIIAIASGGCNVLSYLTADPARIIAVDLNRAHVALTRLKLAGLRHLPDWQSFYRFFGEADERGNPQLYRHHLKGALDDTTRRYWEGRTFVGKRRLSVFRRNIYRRGLLGRFIGAGHVAARFYGCDLSGLLRQRSMAEQRAWFNRELAPLFDKPLVKWVTNRRASLFGLGIPPAQYEALAEGRPMSNVLQQRLEKLTCDFPLRENYFAWQAFHRGYAPGGSGPVPLYLEERNFPKLRARAGRVSVEQVSLTDRLNAMPAGSAHRFVLLDAQDWMTDDQLNALWRSITRAAAPDARVIFRTAGTRSILPGRVSPEILAKWTYFENLSRELGARDRSSIYGGFHIYELG
ncbi:DUF3419 family protein [Aestuariivirga sp.]|uniref:DUF3419 family protein n=1 Tax=Aestuariivirga sp. TaxID=2650926 RepID=UPI0039E5C98F